MKFNDLSPRIREESQLVLGEWGIDAPTDDDSINAAREAFNVRGMVPASPVDALLHLITRGN